MIPTVRRSIHTLTTWLVLVAYMLSGISPAQQLVVCLEPDGGIVLEAALDSGCTPCGETEDSAPDSELLAAECCPCVDIPLPSQGEGPQAKPRASDAQSPWAAVLPPSCPSTVAWVEPVELPLGAGDQPRPAQRLALIRTVILRV